METRLHQWIEKRSLDAYFLRNNDAADIISSFHALSLAWRWIGFMTKRTRTGSKVILINNISDFVDQLSFLGGLRYNAPRKQPARTLKDWLLYVFLTLNVYVFFRFSSKHLFGTSLSSHQAPVVQNCPVPLPTIFVTSPPSARHPALRLARKSFEKSLARVYHERKLDSVAVAIVTSEGSVFEGFHGPLRANETSFMHHRNVDRNSIYRIASISKMFASLETFILRNRGALQL